MGAHWSTVSEDFAKLGTDADDDGSGKRVYQDVEISELQRRPTHALLKGLDRNQHSYLPSPSYFAGMSRMAQEQKWALRAETDALNFFCGGSGKEDYHPHKCSGVAKCLKYLSEHAVSVAQKGHIPGVSTDPVIFGNGVNVHDCKGSLQCYLPPSLCSKYVKEASAHSDVPLVPKLSSKIIMGAPRVSQVGSFVAQGMHMALYLQQQLRSLLPESAARVEEMLAGAH